MSDTTIPAPAGQQDSHMWLITLQLLTSQGELTWTYRSTLTPPPGSTRYSVYLGVREYLTRQDPRMANANVVFFSLERNAL